jgi:predicted dehydrogenase
MRVLIIGCGSIGRRHAVNAAEIASVGIADTNIEKAREIADSIGGEAFSNVQSAMDWKPHAAVIAIPTQLHIKIAGELIEKAIPILIEKPISHSQDGVEEFLIRAKSLGALVFVSCNMRFHAGPATLKSVLPTIGEPLFLRAHYGNYLPSMRPDQDYRNLYAAKKEHGGGVILDSIHEIDYAAWLMGNVSSVSCCAGKLSDLDIDVEDYAALVLQHENGTKTEIHLDYLQQVKRRGCEIVGTNGTLLWASEGKKPEHLEVRRYLTSDRSWRIIKHDADYDGNQPYMEMMRAFICRVSGDSTITNRNLLEGSEGLNALRICEEAHQSNATNTTRTVP